MPHDEKINQLLIEALDKIGLAMKEITETENSREKYSIGKLGRATGLIAEFQQQIFQRNPELRSSSFEDLTPRPQLTESQKEKVAQLSKEEISKIDQLLLNNITSQWQKVAKIVGVTMSENSLRTKEIPDIYYAQRIEKMAKKGIIESQGNLQFMRHSEVRIISRDTP